MFLSIAVFFFSLAACSAAGQDKRCRDECTLVSRQQRAATAMEFLAQSRDYAFQWRSDCSTCKARKQSSLYAAVQYLNAAEKVFVFDEGAKRRVKQGPPTVTCPSWKKIEASYTKVNGQLSSLNALLERYKCSCPTSSTKCGLLNLKYDLLLEDYMMTVDDLRDVLESEACQKANCDTSLECKCDGDDIGGSRCQAPCDELDLGKYWLQVAKSECDETFKSFGMSRPTDCDDCCASQQSFLIEGDARFEVAYHLADQAMELVLSNKKTQRRSPKFTVAAINSSCTRLAEWEAMYLYLSNVYPILDSLYTVVCSASTCPESKYIDLKSLAEIMLDGFLGISVDFDTYTEEFCSSK